MRTSRRSADAPALTQRLANFRASLPDRSRRFRSSKLRLCEVEAVQTALEERFGVETYVR